MLCMYVFCGENVICNVIQLQGMAWSKSSQLLVVLCTSTHLMCNRS